MTDSTVRTAIAQARTIVVKIGSSAVTDLNTGIALDRLDVLVDALEARMRAGSDVIVVSSGAVGAGIAPLGLKKRPTDLATKQAAASVGQLKLAQAWDASFARYDRTVGQVLLTADDVSNRAHHANAQRTLDRLRSLHAVAVVNENDTVATNELRFGDNDRLGALVAHLTGADALVLLSDVDGLYTGDPRKPGPDGQPARMIREVAGPEDLDGVIAGTGGDLGTGGMASKLSAARLAADSGVPVLLAAAAEAGRALTDASVGTVFAARPQRLSARRFWVRHAAETHGRVTIDAGAVQAVVGRRRSLLLPGITAVSGGFSSGDVVELAGPDGEVCARGVSSYDADDIAAVLGSSSADLPSDFRRPVIHADDLVRT
ncbi:glutamate 5-kinase [Gordonia hirsuta DSM 44140 = NBRC 16056]|uniref:Glutamate 5-kinase n=1 Tax=Gordonia hirsuta DSM 44140 = NBRC 16056 TaxID=1121927 RepID=L7LFG8_9ACTN|nr:glutamate 5-kinase [Gordonia hirsuta]GAC58827.1 glutamate 5-kinase [Gordonia hirsuta DSM 44140 = NBRC 16056]